MKTNKILTQRDVFIEDLKTKYHIWYNHRRDQYEVRKSNLILFAFSTKNEAEQQLDIIQENLGRFNYDLQYLNHKQYI